MAISARKNPINKATRSPVFNDISLNQDLDNQVIKIARTLNPTIPMHRTGGYDRQRHLVWLV